MKSPTSTLEDVLGLIEQLSIADQLLIINQLSERLRHILDKKDQAIDILTQSGFGAELWQEVDTDAYLEQERSSWDD